MKNYFNDTLAVTCWGTAVVTLSLTPWLNVDSLVIPKLMILFSLALFVMPTLTKRNLNLKNNSKTRFLFVLLILIFCQLILVIINSEAPIEQQIFGRTGRGLGFLTEMSLIIVMMVTCIHINVKSVQVIITCLLVTTLITSTYSFFQRFGLDFFEWESRTNGIIGTLGNPNFQSSLAAMAIGPSVAHLFSNKSRRVVSFFPIAMLFATIYICESTQGYLLAIISITSLLAIYIWYSSKFFFIGFSFLTICFSVFIGLGMINKGLLAAILYKPSVQSRGEMSRAAFNAAKDNPLFGVGLDSLGDYYWIYRDPQDIQGIKEFSDNAHNIFLNHASTGGFILAILNLCVVLLALVCFLIVQKQIGKFDKNIAALFSAWLVYQGQSLISPSNISMLTWNAILTGGIIGLTRINIAQPSILNKSMLEKRRSLILGLALSMLGMVITYPLFNVDRLQLLSSRTGNGDLAIKSALSYPQSSVRYSRISDAFVDSGLDLPALNLARSAVNFNANSISSWGLILLSPAASYEERMNAKNQVLRLDPLNDSVQSYVVPE